MVTLLLIIIVVLLVVDLRDHRQCCHQPPAPIQPLEFAERRIRRLVDEAMISMFDEVHRTPPEQGPGDLA